MYSNLALGPYDGRDWKSIAAHKLQPEIKKTIPVADIPQATVTRDRNLVALLRLKETQCDEQ